MRIIFLYLLLFIGSEACSQTVMLNKQYYDLVYDTVKKRPVYSHYFFTQKNFIHAYTTDGFTYDKALSIEYQHGNKYYSHPFYDRGHITPHDDFEFDSIANKEVNVYTNVAPQFYQTNRGTWKNIENYVRKLALQIDTVEIWTGVIYRKDPFIPAYFWKLVRCDIYVSAFIVSNRHRRVTNKNFQKILKEIKVYYDRDRPGTYYREN